MLADLDRRLHRIQEEAGEGDGWDILCELLQIMGRVSSMSADMARELLCLPWGGEIPNVSDN